MIYLVTIVSFPVLFFISAKSSKEESSCSRQIQREKRIKYVDSLKNVGLILSSRELAI